MDSPTQAQIERALAIVKAHYPEMPASYRGRRYQIALAAIIETSEAAARVVREYADEAQDSYHRLLGLNAADALLCGDHLKGTQNAE